MGLEFLCGATAFRLSKGLCLSTNMDSSSAKKLYILGITNQGKAFRPSDWAERLAGVMSQFRPGGAARPGGHIAYSPWCVPTSIGNTKCVIVHGELRDHNVMAWDFCVHFAQDNDLQVSDTRPHPPEKPRVN
jgi:Protein of unknown function (DUF3579)